MRKVLIAISLGFLALSIGWILRGRDISLFVDRFAMAESASVPVRMIGYEGDGTGGFLQINDLKLNLQPADPRAPLPSVGTTKKNELALSYRQKVFPFGPLRSESDTFATELPPGDEATISVRHSKLGWLNRLDLKGVHDLEWKRHLYYELNWRKQAGPTLTMLWRYEQVYSRQQQAWPTHESTERPGGPVGLVDVRIEP